MFPEHRVEPEKKEQGAAEDKQYTVSNTWIKRT